MLLETAYKDGDTISFKTVAGEEVFCRLVKKEKDSMKVKSPWLLQELKKELAWCHLPLQ